MTMLGLKHSEETKRKMRESAILRGDCGGAAKLKGRERPVEVLEVMKKTMFKKGQAPANKGKPNFKMRGENHPNWRGGTTPLKRALRMTLEYKLWRRAVFERDDFTCVLCGVRGVLLHADHIKPFSKYPELRTAIDNGRTLCVPCHKGTDTWGFRKEKT